MTKPTFLIVGASLTGAKAAEELRALGFDGRVVAGMNVNVWDVREHIQALVRAGQPAEVAALADPAIPLEALVKELTPES